MVERVPKRFIDLLIDGLPHFDGLDEGKVSKMLSELRAQDDPIGLMLGLLRDHAALQLDDLARERQNAAKELRAAAATVRGIHSAFAPAGGFRTVIAGGLDTIADDLDRRASDMDPPTPAKARGKGRPPHTEFNCAVELMIMLWEHVTGRLPTAGELVEWVEKYISEMGGPLPPTWPIPESRPRKIADQLGKYRSGKMPVGRIKC
jgi:hypothetical protein